MSESNPFAVLVDEEETLESSTGNREATFREKSLTSLLERIFAFSLNKKTAEEQNYTFLTVPSSNAKIELDKEGLSYCLCERLLSTPFDDDSYDEDTCPNHAKENQVLKYLYACYKVFIDEDLDQKEEYKFIKKEILGSIAVGLLIADMYADQDLYRQLIEILMSGYLYSGFFKDLCHAIENEDGAPLEEFYQKLVPLLTLDVQEQLLSTFDLTFFDVLREMTIEENLALLFMECNQPRNPGNGIDYANTLLGELLNISVLPKTLEGAYENFGITMSLKMESSTQNYLWQKLKLINESLHRFFLSLLKLSRKVNHVTLSWLCKCIEKNSDREKLWNTQMQTEFNLENNNTCVADGFMLQLENVLLKFSEPFCNKNKILKVDPTFSAVPNELLKEKKIHLENMSKQTCLLPVNNEDSAEQRPMASSYSFISECFYMTHTAIHLGFVVAMDKTNRMNQGLSTLYEAMNDESMGNADFFRERLRTEMRKFISYKAQLTEPHTLASLFNLMSFTCYWLCQVAVKQYVPVENSFAPIEESEISFPLRTGSSNILKCIPEFIVKNISSTVAFIKRFSVNVFEEQGYEKLEPILTFLLMFMGNHGYITNPHLRAELAESLEGLLPSYEEVEHTVAVGNFQRNMLFTEYSFKQQVVRSLLEVFVGIEMTGQSVEFEQKFNYRRPMYKIMEYLWGADEYQNHFRQLAEEAEANMDAVKPPIFLRFINLLINDSVFLLDESLTNMASLRELLMRIEREADLPPQERVQLQSSIRHTGRIARIDNILGKDTIMALEQLTSKITIVFTHSTMVERMASMLNYFLFNLVGPKMKNFKVRNPKDYSFEPAETVLKICKIYINLKESDAFCLAISQDGRSYSKQLFQMTEEVLLKIGGNSYVQEIRELAAKVSKKAEDYQASEECISGAPDHFLDPIMSTLMTDPVILPSSRKVVDRVTIARHLLSDQTDPFNRSPLSMDQVIPNTELAKEIKEWIALRQNTNQ